MQEEYSAKIAAAPEDAARGLPGSNPHEPGHEQEPGQEADIAEMQTAGRKHENMVTEGNSKGSLHSPKVAASYGINRREVTLLSPSF